jgi:hypothetical protein
MVVCPNCPTLSFTASDRFCKECGSPLQNLHPTIARWVENFFSGSIQSSDGEVWTYEKGVVKCIEGNPKGALYKWTGENFSTQQKEKGNGTFDGTKLDWKFPQTNDVFYSYFWEENKKCFRNEKGALRVNPVSYASFVHWKMNGDKLIAEGDLKEGISNEWTISGDVPTPVALFVAMFTRSQKLLEEAIAKSKLRFTRCNKLVLTSAGPPLLCVSCQPNPSELKCICCTKPVTEKFIGQICKSCAPRKNFCIHCDEPLRNGKSEAFLCRDCGLGSNSSNCCKMKKSNTNY